MKRKNNRKLNTAYLPKERHFVYSAYMQKGVQVFTLGIVASITLSGCGIQSPSSVQLVKVARYELQGK